MWCLYVLRSHHTYLAFLSASNSSCLRLMMSAANPLLSSIMRSNLFDGLLGQGGQQQQQQRDQQQEKQHGQKGYSTALMMGPCTSGLHTH